MSATLRAAIWTVDVPQATPKPESITITSATHTEEAIIDDDKRTLVSLADFQDGGKYRSIVKIQSRFRAQDGSDVWMMGTGWLIADDLLVTAGHVVYDKSEMNLGACTQIKCYIGYTGVGSVPPQEPSDGGYIPAVQPRYGSHVVTTEAWIKNQNDRIHDVAFIRVHKPFRGHLNVFTPVDTATSGTLNLGVVGYPGDMTLNKEKGAQMYEMFKDTSYDLDKHPLHMISYRISTFGGQSGAPVLSGTGSNLSAIGTHCYGAGYGDPSNSGNPIGGQWGNNYRLLTSLFAQSGVFSEVLYKISYITPFPVIPANLEEGFLDILKTVAKIGATAAPLGGMLLGPVGATVGAAAGALLGAIGGQESFVSEGKGKEHPDDLLARGAPERAVLAEAALQGVISVMQNNDSQDPAVKTILQDMERHYKAFAPDLDKDGLVTRLSPQLAECALGAIFQQLNSAMSAPRSTAGPLTNHAFTESLLGSTLPLPGDEEGAFDFLGPLISKAVKVAKPILSQGTKFAINTILPALLEPSSTESTLVSSDNEKASRFLFKRAILADAALSALTSLNKEQLGRLKIQSTSQESGKYQEEGIMDVVKSVVQKMGPPALNAVRATVRRLAPHVIDVTVKLLEQKKNEIQKNVNGQASVDLNSAVHALNQDVTANARPITMAANGIVPIEQKSAGFMSVPQQIAEATASPAARSLTNSYNPDQPPLMESAPPLFAA